MRQGKNSEHAEAAVKLACAVANEHPCTCRDIERMSALREAQAVGVNNWEMLRATVWLHIAADNPLIVTQWIAEEEE
ncbi:MAG: hypothetical protein JNK38_02320 [Acidobacteria bacterium]|nr:hypothetical protein [Acidobacteriota bacterium]